ncbi:MAG TPA: DegT/DnrJ/EryC1/StrS family aminotransferase [Acetobacteraceae bacterium]|nr:DegT/DnrJ/EryC1/StrS family aminotransferase [Acetobacteraceae bacterium]
MSAPAISVPQANPGAGYRALQGEIDAAVTRVLQSGWYILGQEVRAFEAEFAAWLGATAAVGCGNGTDALALALRALGVGPGMSVVTVSHTAVATVAAIEMVGATPLLIDIEPDYYTMDPGELAEVLAHPPAGVPPIRAVIPVHLYGQPAALEPIVAACRGHGVVVIEDCAQAHGATIAGRKVGTFTEVATFSFYPTKNLGALGDGGMLATQDANLGADIAALRQYGWRTHYISDAVGVNSRLDEMQAAILRVKLCHLDTQNARRQAIAVAYDVALRGASLAPPARREGVGHVFHLYVLRTPERAALQARLREARIGTGIHYPAPVHLQPAYRRRVALGPARCRATEIAAEQVLSLPMYPELTDAQVAQVCEALRRV